MIRQEVKQNMPHYFSQKSNYLFALPGKPSNLLL